MDKKQIDSIIWGDVDKKILDKKIPFYAANWYLRANSEEFIFLLFRLFTNYVFEKSGYTNSLASMKDLRVENYMDWVDQNQEHLDYVGKTRDISRIFTLPPIYFTQFRKNEDVHDILIVNNTHAFFQALQLLKESNGEMPFEKIKEKYHIFEDEETGIAFDFIKNMILHNKGKFQNPILALRPFEMILKLNSLDNYFEEYSELPKKLFTKEEYEKLSIIERAGLFGLSKEDLMHGQCNDYNFEELMKGHSDIFPDFKFISFYELLKNKIPLELQDWNKQRDEFIKNLEDMIESEYSDSPPNFDREYDYLQKGQKMHDDGNFEEAILNCYKTVEGILGKIHPKTASSKFYYKVIECEKDPKCSKYADNLKYINKIRNSMSAHVSPHIPDLEDSLLVLQMTNITFSGLTKHRVYGKYDTFEK